MFDVCEQLVSSSVLLPFTLCWMSFHVSTKSCLLSVKCEHNLKQLLKLKKLKLDEINFITYVWENMSRREYIT